MWVGLQNLRESSFEALFDSQCVSGDPSPALRYMGQGVIQIVRSASSLTRLTRWRWRGWEETDTRRSSFINSLNRYMNSTIRHTLSGMSIMIFCNRLYYFQWNKNQNLFYTSCVYHLSKLPASLCLSSGDFELWTWKCPPRCRGPELDTKLD